MNFTQNDVENAGHVVTGLQTEVFFGKLASLGITPETEEERDILWSLGNDVLRDYPRDSEVRGQIKQASCETFGEHTADDAGVIAGELCKNPTIVKAAHVLLLLQQQKGV